MTPLRHSNRLKCGRVALEGLDGKLNTSVLLCYRGLCKASKKQKQTNKQTKKTGTFPEAKFSPSRKTAHLVTH